MKLRRWIPLVVLVLGLVLTASAALAQEPTPLLPGQEPETARPIPYWFSIPLALAAVGLLALLGLLYLRLSRRFFGRDEPPPVAARPRFAGMSAAQPVAAAPQGAPAAAPRATAAAVTAGSAPAPPKEAPKEAAKEAPKAEAPAAEEPPKQEAAPAAEEPPKEEAPAAEEPKTEAAAKPAADGPDQETFDRVLAEQLEKGVDRRVAEGRARAAAMKASREKAGGG